MLYIKMNPSIRRTNKTLTIANKIISHAASIFYSSNNLYPIIQAYDNNKTNSENDSIVFKIVH